MPASCSLSPTMSISIANIKHTFFNPYETGTRSNLLSMQKMEKSGKTLQQTVTQTNKTHSEQTTHLYFTCARAPTEVLKTSSVPN